MKYLLTLIALTTLSGCALLGEKTPPPASDASPAAAPVVVKPVGPPTTKETQIVELVQPIERTAEWERDADGRILSDSSNMISSDFAE